ncbi:MAG: hypothetical protein U5L96_21000 [Owenweeksia sp.]|nr:hypothetical protein [Owenweeksia sp.]
MKAILLILAIQLIPSSSDPQEYYNLTSEEFFALPEVQKTITPDSLDRALLEAALFFATNEVLRQKVKERQTYQPILQQAARFHAEYIAKTGKVQHLNKSQEKYRTPYDRTVAFDGDFSAVAEKPGPPPCISPGGKRRVFC